MNTLSRMPIRFQLIIIVVIVALPAVVIIITSGIQQRNRALNDARMDTRRLVDTIASEQRILVTSARQLMVSLSQLPEIREKNITKTNLLLLEILKSNANFTGIVITDNTGSIWASAAPLVNPITIHDRRVFKNALANWQLSSGEFQIGPASHKPNLDLGYPYKNNQGKFNGVIAVGIDLQYYRFIFEQIQFINKATMVLIDHNGVILFSTADADRHIGKMSNTILFKRMLEGPDAYTLNATGITGDPQLKERCLSYQKLRLEGEQSPYMYIQVGILVESVLSLANKQMVRNLSIFSLVLTSALFIAWFISKRSITDRIVLLKRASRSLASGDLGIRVSDLVKGGELGELGESFDAMAQQLMLREKLLAEKQHQLEELNTYLELRIEDAVTDSRKKDQILILQSRQAAMGEMISNIAHQWRQPLNTLALIIQEIRMTYDRAEFTKELLDTSVANAMGLINNMSKTIDYFRNFFKPDKEKHLFEVNQVINKTLTLIESGLKNMNINIVVEASNDTNINGYENEYCQVLLNIIINSKDAFGVCNIDSHCIITITVFKEDNKSVVTLTDNAGGIPEDIIDKIFDPYFTTKGPDKGTGIGLYMAKTIIEKNMGGRLTVRNTGSGAEFRIEV